ncbi:MAG: hypothetical protein H6Q90_6053 [Deltaproteobacteria bacterium]|nr:hypothetical protein [Deltaproteobacteria bacterium]
MHRISILIILTSLGVGCAADSGDESFIIRSNVAAPTEGTCEFTPDVNAQALSRGQLSLFSKNPYVLHALFQSRIVAPEGKESQRTVFLKGADVSVVVGPIEMIDAEGNVTTDAVEETLPGFQSVFTGALNPNGGLLVAEFDVVPLAALASIRARAGGAVTIHAQVQTTATPFGDYYGAELRGAPFQFPVTVCNDCVVSPVVDDQGAPVNCPLVMGTVPRLGNPCNPYQDGIVDCCNDTGGPVCPAPVSILPPPTP